LGVSLEQIPQFFESNRECLLRRAVRLEVGVPAGQQKSALSGFCIEQGRYRVIESAQRIARPTGLSACLRQKDYCPVRSEAGADQYASGNDERQQKQNLRVCTHLLTPTHVNQASTPALDAYSTKGLFALTRCCDAGGQPFAGGAIGVEAHPDDQ
jgi:hypothetical protein